MDKQTEQNTTTQDASLMNKAPVDTEELSAQATLYQLMGRFLEQEIDSDLLAIIRGEWREALKQAGLGLDASFFEAPADALQEELAEEYTALMVAPGAIMPYASVAKTGRMFQEPADRAVEAYRKAGLEFRHIHSGEFPDHIGVMLSFVGTLAQLELAAHESGDAERAADLRAQREAFIVDQLATWAPGWCRRAKAAAMHIFYEQLLAMVEQALWQDIALLVDRHQLKDLAAQNQQEPPKLDYDADFRKASGL